MLQRTTTLPAVPVEQNGSGVSATRVERFDRRGNLVWLKDERGTITYHEYDAAGRNLVQTIQDVDGSRLDLPSNWTTPNGGGQHLVTDYTFDSLGRQREVLGPPHEVDVDGTATTLRTASWTVYNDADHETWAAQGYYVPTTDTYTLVNPVSITKRNAAGTRSESIHAVRASTSGKLTSADTFDQSSYVRWSVNLSNTAGQLTSTRVYHTIPASGDGSSGTNYDETTFAYDSLGRQNRQETPGGTITRTVYNALDQAIAVYVGTDDTCATDDDPTGAACYEGGSGGSSSSSSSANPNDMVLLIEYAYAGPSGCTGCRGGGGAGRLIATIQHLGPSPLPSGEGQGEGDSTRTTELMYDWRNRQEFTLTDPDDQGRYVYTRSEYDNLDQVIRVERYHDVAGDGPDPDGGTHPDDILISRSETDYDDRSQVYCTRTYAVNPETGTVGDALEANAWYDAAGNRTASEDALERRTEWQCDSLGRTVKETLPDPDDEGEQLAPWTVFTHDAAGSLITTTDRLDHTTTFGYDVVGRRVSTTDPNGATTHFAFDAAGNMASLTDPVNNTAQWFYDHAGRVVEEENQLGDSRYFAYSADGDLAQKTDRNGRVTQYGYDFLRHRTSETWLDGTTTVRTFSFSYNLAGDMLTASDPAATYTYVYDRRGRATSIIQEIAGLAPTVVMSQEYHLLGPRSQLSMSLGGTADFQNAYTFDHYGRTASITQSGVTGGNAVAEKRVEFTYDSVNQFTTITRYNNLAGTQLVAQSSYTFDNAGRLTALSHTKGSTTLATHAWTWDAASRITAYTNGIDGAVIYTNDPASQLTAADYTYTPPIDDELYVYDANGNRTNNDVSVGTNNRLLTDGTYRYEYDAEGNRALRYVDGDSSGAFNTGDTDITVYTWDYRNRLTKVTHYADYSHYASQELGESVEYAYDHRNRWVRKMLDSDGTANSSAIFVYDDNQIVMQFDNTGEGDATSCDLSHRYAWGAGVDQLLADEQVSSLTTLGTVLWPLCDHISTVRDLATFDDGTDTTTVSDHRLYHAFGEVVSETNSAVACLFSFSARVFDRDTGLQNNLNRWYDPTTGQWLSEDRVYSDPNLYRYCWNNPVLHVDPKGLWVWPWDPNANWVWPWDPNATWEPAFVQTFEIIAAEMEKVWGQLQNALCGLAKAASNSNIVTCACFVVGLGDMAPGIGQIPLVDKADCGCNVVTAANLYCNKQFTKADAYALLTAIDCMSIELGGLFGVPIGGAVGTVLNPGAGTAGGAAVGLVFGDALVDVAAFAAQNYVTQGTVLPEAQAKACCKAPKEAADALKGAFDKLKGILGK